MIAKQIIFIGRVQGVGFRFTAYNIAKRSLLTGYVRNLPDGSVEMLAQGNEKDIEDCLRDIKETLPNHVRETKQTQLPHDPRYTDFKITY